MKKMNNKGFSLVELIIVMAIMAVLIGVMAPAYSKYVEQAKKSRDVSAVDSIMTAAESVLIDLDARKDGDMAGTGEEKIHQIVLKYTTDSKIVVDSASTCDDAETEMALILGTEGTVMAGTWKDASNNAITEGTLTVTIDGGFVKFAGNDSKFFSAVADYSSELGKRME